MTVITSFQKCFINAIVHCDAITIAIIVVVVVAVVVDAIVVVETVSNNVVEVSGGSALVVVVVPAELAIVDSVKGFATLTDGSRPGFDDGVTIAVGKLLFEITTVVELGAVGR